MCVNIEVILPTIEQFLLMFSLRSGSFLILIWTTARSLFCIVFFSSAILEVLIGKSSPCGAWLVTDKKYVVHYSHGVYYCLLTLLLCETVVFVFMLYLALGLCCYRSHFLEHYVVSRFITWTIEVLALITACLVHKLLIGWYLGLLIFVILEFYSLIVVYSYYAEVTKEVKEL